MHKTILITTALVVTTLAAAQSSTQNRQLTPEQRARMAQMQPIFDLSQTIRLLPDLEKNKATALSKTQAQTLLPILTTLQKANAIQPNDAKKYLTQIEDKILTEKQLTALDALVIKAQKEREAARAQRQASGQTPRIPGVPGGLIPGQRPNTNQNGQNAQGQNGQNGQRQFNPFKQGRGAEALKAYIAVLQKK